jgi:hypothetical protein
MTSDWLACLWCMHMHRLIVRSTSSDCWTAATLCYCRQTLELMQRRLLYTLWRERVLVPEQSLPRLISCSISMLPGLASWQVGQTHLHPSLAAQPFSPLAAIQCFQLSGILANGMLPNTVALSSLKSNRKSNSSADVRQGRCVCYWGTTITCTDPR